jgi:hypothetical protein
MEVFSCVLVGQFADLCALLLRFIAGTELNRWMRSRYCQ